MTQAEFDFGNTKRRHRSIILTVSRTDFERVKNLKPGHIVTIGCVNDIVSCLAHGMDAVRGMPHEYRRRYDLLKRAFHGNHRSVYVRYAIDEKIKAQLTYIHTTASDANTFMVEVTAAA